MKLCLKNSLRLVSTLAVLTVFIVYFLLNRQKFRLLLHVNILYILPVAVLYILSIASNGLFTKLIMRPFGKEIGLKESFYVSLISSVGNFFAPVGAGFGFRAIYLKRRHNFAYSDYTSTLAGNYIIVFLVNSFFGLLALWQLRHHANHQYAVLVITFAIVFGFSLLLSLIKIPKTPLLPNSMQRIFQQITDGWNNIISHKKLMLQLIALTSLNLLITLLIALTIIKSLHLSIGAAPLLLFSVLGSLSLFINITPANLGIKEAIYLFSATVLGFSVSQILSIALIDRAVLFLVLAVSWLVAPKKFHTSVKASVKDEQ